MISKSNYGDGLKSIALILFLLFFKELDLFNSDMAAYAEDAL